MPLLPETSDFHEPVLPGATRKRWQPIRGGLLNLYLYDYEEFRYEDGRLILRGNNGTGKSRVMALQLPFLFDGRLATNRVEPDADPSKRMEWNLLMGRHNERLGYTWIEFGKCEPVGNNGKPPAQRFITLGCGLSATKNSGMREPWFFITEQRVGKDLFLQSAAGHPLSKSALKEAIGETGFYETATEYRRAVDEALFGLGKQRYEAMVDLLIQLRKPQLSRNLDEKMLARVLAEALPPPSPQMITDVAESLRGLESDRMELNRFQSARDGVDSFLKTYKRYARIASRRRADEVRSSHNRYEYASKELRKAERDNAVAQTQLATAAETVRALEIEGEEINSRIEALRSDPKMRSADEIKQAAEQERQAARDLDDASDAADTANARLDERRRSRQTAFDEAQVTLNETNEMSKRARVLAGSSELGKQYDAAFAPLKLDLSEDETRTSANTESIRKTVDQSITDRLRGCVQLQNRNNELAAAEDELRRAKTARDAAQSAVEQVIENERSCEERRKVEVDAYLESYEMWRRDSDELTMPCADELAAAVDDWSQQPDGTNPVAEVAAGAKLRAQESLSEQRVTLQQRADGLIVERTAVAEMVEKLEHGFHEPPELPPLIDGSARENLAGAPFWSLVDFQESCPTQTRANIEVALASAGFLNAWVTPDGSVLTSDFEDVLFALVPSAQKRNGTSLAAVLQPAPSRPDTLPDDIIEAILQQIGFEPSDSSTWVSANGRWQNGPLHGQCRKKFPQFIGHDAREHNRLEQLAIAQAGLRQIETDVEQVQSEITSIDGRVEAIRKQAEAIPGDTAVRSTAGQLLLAHQTTVECRTTLTAAEREVSLRRTVTESAKERRDQDANDLGLSDWVDRIADLQHNITSYQQTLAALWPSIEHFVSLRLQFLATLRAVREAEQDATKSSQALHERKTRHAKAAERLQTLQETIGTEAEEILIQLNAAQQLAGSLGGKIKDARKNETDAGNEVARTEERIKSRREAIDTETTARQKACEAFQRLCQLGLLGVATGESQDDDSVNWSVSRTVEVARQTESTFAQANADDGAWDRVQQMVTTTIQELNTALSQHAFISTLTTTDGLYLVTVPYQGRDRSVQELRELLAEEVEQRRMVLDEREREIIENHLIGEVAAKLHDQIREALQLVDRMNAEIQRRPMSTGMALKFDWNPDDELSRGIVEMCKKLRGATGGWTPDERAAIGRYLQEHIKDVRASREAGTWHEHLAEALDYRRWHRFWVMRKQETGWKRLTKRTHGTGSGGEKAVALTIPQFAAAAAHYSSARDDAPRLILLDEAFVGIDPDMRGKCMELINVFDLDFLLTSESEWGCYATLPGVAIYQLSTRSGYDAVFVTRWVWNGKQKLREEIVLPPAICRVQ